MSPQAILRKDTKWLSHPTPLPTAESGASLRAPAPQGASSREIFSGQTAADFTCSARHHHGRGHCHRACALGCRESTGFALEWAILSAVALLTFGPSAGVILRGHQGKSRLAGNARARWHAPSALTARCGNNEPAIRGA